MNNKQINQEKNNKIEEKVFQTTMSKEFLEIIGTEKVWDQLKTQAYAYFQNINWYVVEGSIEKKENKSIFIIKTMGEKGIWKEIKDESEIENKSIWQKTKEKVGLNK